MKKEIKSKSNKITYIVILILAIVLIASTTMIIFLNKRNNELVNNVNNYLENENMFEEEYMIMEWNNTQHLVKKEDDLYEEVYKFNDEHTADNFLGVYNNNIYFSKGYDFYTSNLYSLSLENFEETIIIDNFKELVTFKCYSYDHSFEVKCSENELNMASIRPDFMIEDKVYLKSSGYDLSVLDLKDANKIKYITNYYTNASNLSEYTETKFFNESGGIIYEINLNTNKKNKIIDTESAISYFIYNNGYIIYSEVPEQENGSDYNYLNMVNIITKQKTRIAKIQEEVWALDNITIGNKLYYMSLDNSILYEYDMFRKTKKEYFDFGDSSKYTHSVISTDENGIIIVDRYYNSSADYCDTTYLFNGKVATEKDLKIEIKLLDGTTTEKIYERVLENSGIIRRYWYK